ncbi:thioredoxin domain-containing protein [Altererythrobacter arenosus]|uniref:Thioredoxin domain-containing protein n=1 Tax=Altererythrobacter arenosus TaxID=3032592 RepID=A0ABY8FWZ9_9SPHN|nr:thioredoxin domain-containing protein [Altererythrobacter sp. CAU 1644]WFL76549.1 thioredoxin domain-containing protein [Altererythrobacter sp. CAU 1644]
MTKLRKIALTAFTAPLALALAACSSEEEAGPVQGEPIAAIPAPEGQQWVDTVTVTDKGGYALGNPEAPIRLVEYGSLTCPGCAAFSAASARPIEEYVNSGRVNFEFRSFVIHGPIDLALTALVSCASPETVHPLSEQVWSNLGEIQQRAYADQAAMEQALSLPEDQRFVAFGEVTGLYDFFSARGLSEAQARACLADFDNLTRLAKFSQGYAQEDGITGTPTFTLNGSRLTETGWPDVEAALQRAGAR